MITENRAMTSLQTIRQLVESIKVEGMGSFKLKAVGELKKL